MSRWPTSWMSLDTYAYRSWNPSRRLAKTSRGIIGRGYARCHWLGGIGRAVARRAVVAGMRVSGFDPSEESARLAAAIGVDVVDLSTVWANSDFISVNAPLNPQTHHLLNDDAFSR